jgi:hypothetical protein
MNATQRREWREYVYGCTDLTEGQRLVLLALESRADYRDGTNARPGVDGLARMCALKPRIVEYALARGRQLNLIQQTARANPKRGLCAVYRLVPAPAINPHGDADRSDFNPHGDADRTDFNPHETEFQPARNGVSTRTSVQPSIPLTPNPLLQNNSRADKGHRLPPDWEPPTAVMTELRKRWPGIDLREALDEFRDYWCSESGARARKTDWTRTFRNRIRDLDKRNNRFRGNGTPATESAYDRKKRKAAEVIRQLSAETRNNHHPLELEA